MSNPPVSKAFLLKNLITLRFWRYLFNSIWLFFPAILFLVMSYAAFWALPQGKDLMVITLENPKTFIFFILAQSFWSYVTWYSSRLAAKAKAFMHKDDDPLWTAMRVQFPRLLAYLCYSIVILAFFQLGVSGIGSPELPGWLCHVLLGGSIPVYFFIYQRWNRFTGKHAQTPAQHRAFLKSVQTTTWVILGVALAVVFLFHIFLGLILLLLGMQQALVLLLIIRRKLIEAKGESFYQMDDADRPFTPESPFLQRYLGLLLDKEDRGYMKFFLVVSSITAIVYFATVFSIDFAVYIGSFPFVFIAFGVLLLLGNTVAYISVLTRFNFHVVLLLLAFIIGLFNEPHNVQLEKKKDPSRSFSKRQDIAGYLRSWVSDSARMHALNDTGVHAYPVIFSLADGGASRSGFWVAASLSYLEDRSGGKFSEHLFCLSGASGGSVGNATFYNLLRSRDPLKQRPNGDTTMFHAATKYLKSDFLTFTLARMLGPDVFRHIFGLKFIDDRSAALAHAMETSCGTDNFLYDSMATGLSQLVTQTDRPYNHLPILCINTTRMQDGSPAVISTIKLGNAEYNQRLDVLSMLDTTAEMKLSSALVLGASFPYISPAGRFNSSFQLTQRDGTDIPVTEPEYFVDGGYFDNSGSGVVNEMIGLIRDIMDKDPFYAPYRQKLQFYVLHISNDPQWYHLLKSVNPLVNDLAAPIKTLMGAYGTQTIVNDRRLVNYMTHTYLNKDHYIPFNLYQRFDPNRYSMNWVISAHALNRMEERVLHHEALDQVLSLVR